MARQVGLLKLEGALGDISFYKSFYGYLARTKTGVDRKTVLSDPRFQRTRENAMEFGRGAKTGKLLRDAIRPILRHAKDTMTVQRLTQRMMKVLQADTVNRRGMRTVSQGDLSLLRGFDFNKRASLNSIIQMGFENEFDRVSGTAVLNLHSYKPRRDIKAPTGTSHYKIVFGVAALNFEILKFVFGMNDSGILLYDRSEIQNGTLTANLSQNLSFPVVIVVGIVFYQKVSGEFYDLEDGAFNALGVVGINKED